MNDAGVVVFPALLDDLENIGLFAGIKRNDGPPIQLDSFPVRTELRPQISNNGRIVFRNGFDDIGEIVVLQYPGGGVGDVGYYDGFDSVGRAPGISPSGDVIVFAGVKDNRAGVFAAVL